MHRILMLFLASCFITIGWGQGTRTHFGEIALQVGDGPEQTYYARTVTLYREVSIVYDTTLQMQTDDHSQLFFYPQLHHGNHFVLHMMLSPLEKPGKEKETEFFDVYFDLGDTLPEVLQVEGVDSTVFFCRDGLFIARRMYSRDLKGTFQIRRVPGMGEYVSGALDVQFQFPAPEDSLRMERIVLRGELSIPEANLRKGTVTGLTTTEAVQKRRFKRNLLVAAVLTVFIVAVALR